MGKLKYALLAMFLVVLTAPSAMADAFDKNDMAFAFDNTAISSDFGEMSLLSDQEMISTEGEWLP